MRPTIELITSSQFLVSITATVFASSGFFQLLMLIYQSREKEKERKRLEETQKKLINIQDFNALCRCVTGIAMFRIAREAKRYIDKGYVTSEEYHTLKHNLYEPYVALGGNGLATKFMQEVEELPMHEGKKTDYSE